MMGHREEVGQLLAAGAAVDAADEVRPLPQQWVIEAAAVETASGGWGERPGRGCVSGWCVRMIECGRLIGVVA
jgi:hypothetical protein